VSDDAPAPTRTRDAGERVIRTFEVRHVQLGRALLAALAAIMITFSPDHSAAVGLAVFSGWAIATALVLIFGAWLAYPAGRRGAPVLLGALTIAAGMVTGIPPLRSTAMFFVVVIAWAVATGLAELIGGIRLRRTAGVAGNLRDEIRDEARDGILVGALTLVLGVGLLLVNPAYSLEYFIADAGRSFTLTGITIGVGLFGGYAAIVAVVLGIAGFSPRRAVTTDGTPSGGSA